MVTLLVLLNTLKPGLYSCPQKGRNSPTFTHSENRTPLLVGEHYKHSKVLEVKAQGREHTVARPWHWQHCPCVSLPGEEAQVQRVEEDLFLLQQQGGSSNTGSSGTEGV